MITENENVRYYLPLYKSNGNYLRVTRNSAFVVTCPALLKRKLDKCCSLLLVGDVSLTKFVIVGFTNKPYYQVYDLFNVRSIIDERIKFMMRMNMNKHLLNGFNLALPNQISALEKYLYGAGISLFS